MCKERLSFPQASEDLSVEEKRYLYDEWKKTGWSQSRFCKKHDIPLDHFAKWSIQLQAESAGGFYEVTTRAVHVNHQEPMTMEFCFPNQVIARIQAQEPQFIVLFREVLNAASTIR